MNQIQINPQYEVILALSQQKMHGRELSKKINISLTKTQKELKRLERENIIDYNLEGKNHIYYIKKNLTAKLNLINAENYKLNKLIKIHNILEPIITELIKKSKSNLIILFGSYAKGTQTKNSDIDIYIETTNPKIKKEIENIYNKISVKIGPFDTTQPLVKEIQKNHIILKGGEHYHEKYSLFS
jgi:predicted nucleotidyltransferase